MKNYSLLIMGISNGDEDGGGDRWRWLWGHFPVLAGCRNRDFLSPESPLRWRRCCGTFCGFLVDDLGFVSRGLLIGEGGKVDGGTGGPHPLWAPPGLARAHLGCGHPGVLLHLCFVVPCCSG